MPLVSVLIGTRNRPEPVIRCLESVLDNDHPLLEVLILDDCSEDITVCDILTRHFSHPSITCFRGERQLGVAGGRNLLMQEATGDIFVFIDDDAAFATETAITQSIDLLGRHPDVGILSFKVINHEGGDVRLRTPFTRLTRRRDPHVHERQQRVSYYLGTAHAIRRELIERCGPYQENLLFGEEELDLSYRAIRAGYEILYVPSISAHHYPQASVIEGERTSQPLTELELHIRNRIWLAYKHLPLPHLLTSLSVWLTFYGIQAVRETNLRAYVRGLLAGWSGLRGLSRLPLRGEALAYLRKNHGRLWY